MNFLVIRAKQITIKTGESAGFGFLSPLFIIQL